MSQSVVSPEVPPPMEIEPRDEFHYSPMSMLAPASLFLGICSLSGLASVSGLAVGLLGIVFGLACIVQVNRSQGRLSGRAMAYVGIALSAVCMTGGAYLHYTDYVNELPPGYQRVNFPRDISANEFIFENGQWKLHPEVEPLVDQKVFLKGYVWQTRATRGMRSFVLLKDNGECCMGGDPALYDMIEVRMNDGKTFDAISGLVSVAGTLRADITPAPGEPVYVLEADQAGRARTAF